MRMPSLIATSASLVAASIMFTGFVSPVHAQTSDFTTGQMAWEDLSPLARQKAYERVIKCAGIAKGDEVLSDTPADKAKHTQEMNDLILFARKVSGKEIAAMVPDLTAQTKAYFAVLESGDTAKGITMKGDCGTVLAAARE